jgi:DNA-binding MarR family transcriptional regulator
MTEKPSETVSRAWARLMTAQQLALASIERELKAAGLPPLVWYDVLLEVERVGGDGLRPFELERAMLLAQYNLSRLIDRMERAGYVERRACDDDGRGQLIAITERGKAIRRKMWPVYARAIDAAVGRHLSMKQAEVLGDLLGLLIDGHGNEKAR